MLVGAGENMEKSIREETAIVLDFLPNGYPFDKRPSHRKTPIVQAIGVDRFVLLELVPKKGETVTTNEIIYIGEGKRDKIHHIIGRLQFSRLTTTAKSELNYVIADLVDKKEKEFIDFLNNSQPLSTRMHQLELLPGLGKKHMWEIINAREEQKFESFDDLKKRVKLLPDPKKIIARRILSEIEGKEKYRLFTD